MRLAVITTHPIQYYAPVFRRLAERDVVTLRVFYNWKGGGDEEAAYDPGFEEEVQWDLPLLEGYDYTFVMNAASDPGTHHFWGLVNPELVTSVKNWHPDAVLIHGWNYASHLWALLRFHGNVPVLFRGDSTLIDESSGPRKWMRRLWLRWVYRHVEAALYVGTNNRKYYEAHGLESQQLYWVPHVVDNDRFAEHDGAEEEAMQWRRDLGIPEEHPVLLFAGKIEHKKAPDTLLEAFLQLEREDAHLVVVGSGPLEERLRRDGAHHPRIHFLGFQNQSRMPVVYRLGEVFVLPSRGPGETWGLAVNEAMACGSAVVVSDKVGCAPDLVDEETGAVVPAENAGALRETLSDLLRDKEQLKQMGHRSAERIEEWSIGKAAMRMEEAVKETIDRVQ